MTTHKNPPPPPHMRHTQIIMNESTTLHTYSLTSHHQDRGACAWETSFMWRVWTHYTPYRFVVAIDRNFPSLQTQNHPMRALHINYVTTPQMAPTQIPQVNFQERPACTHRFRRNLPVRAMIFSEIRLRDVRCPVVSCRLAAGGGCHRCFGDYMTGLTRQFVPGRSSAKQEAARDTSHRALAASHTHTHILAKYTHMRPTVYGTTFIW